MKHSGKSGLNERMREDFERAMKPDSLQKMRSGCGFGYQDVGMNAGWAAWQAATLKVEAEHKKYITHLKQVIADLDHALKNAECAASMMQRANVMIEQDVEQMKQRVAILSKERGRLASLKPLSQNCVHSGRTFA